jgi:hypothetical protein
MYGCGSKSIDLELGEHLDRETSVELIESNRDMQSASRVANQYNFPDRVGKACVPNLGAYRKSARRGEADTALEEKRKEIKDESRCAIIDASYWTAKNARQASAWSRRERLLFGTSSDLEPHQLRLPQKILTCTSCH